MLAFDRALPDLSTSEKTKAQGDYKPSMDIDTDRRDLPKGLDDTYRPSIDRMYWIHIFKVDCFDSTHAGNFLSA